MLLAEAELCTAGEEPRGGDEIAAMDGSQDEMPTSTIEELLHENDQLRTYCNELRLEQKKEDEKRADLNSLIQKQKTDHSALVEKLRLQFNDKFKEKHAQMLSMARRFSDSQLRNKQLVEELQSTKAQNQDLKEQVATLRHQIEVYAEQLASLMPTPTYNLRKRTRG